MRSIGKFLLILITFIISIVIVGGTISLFLNKAGFLDINESIIDKPLLKHFAIEEKYEENINTKMDNYEKQLLEKEELITQQELTIQQLEINLESIIEDYKKLELEVDDKSASDVNSESKDIVNHYNSMKDKKVAEIFDTMKNEEVVNILSQMDSDKIPKILENMDSNKVSEITRLFLKTYGN